MKYLTSLTISLLSATAIAAPSLPRRDQPAPYVPAPSGVATTGKYIVVYNDDASSAVGIADLPNNVTRVYKGSFRGYAGKFNKATLTAIRANPAVAYVEEDQVVSIVKTQSPAEYNLAITSQPNKLATNNQTAYSYTHAGLDVSVYLIDTGVQANNTEFVSGRATLIKNYVTGSPDTDENGHGTHCAGTVGGKTYGVAKRASLKAIKVLDKDGAGAVSDVISGIQYAVQDCNGGMCVISMSLGTSYSTALNSATASASQSGIPVVVAAGNSNDNACSYSPSSEPSAITVAAIDNTYTRASFSNYGNCTDIFAPGVNIKSAWIGSTSATMVLSGTSMSTPHIAGLAAYFIQGGAKTVNQVKTRLVKNAQMNLVQDPEGSPNVLGNNGFY